MTQAFRSKAVLDLEAQERQIALVRAQGVGDGVIVSAAELEAFIEITRGAEQLMARFEDAHQRGETFPLDVAIGAGRLGDKLTQYKGNKAR